MEKQYFLVSITTTKGSDWRSKIKEINELGLPKVAIFPTCLRKPERQEMFELLLKTNLKEIPFCHIRTDMDYAELDFLKEKYNTKVFNLHSSQEHKHFFDYSPYREMIYLENVYTVFSENELKKWAGICLDLSHLENHRQLEKDKYDFTIKMLKKYPVGCNHISAMAKEPFKDNKEVFVVGRHYFEDLSEFDYLKRYPLKYFSKYIAIEIENSLKDQLKAIDYIYGILSKGERNSNK